MHLDFQKFPSQTFFIYNLTVFDARAVMAQMPCAPPKMSSANIFIAFSLGDGGTTVRLGIPSSVKAHH
jgi:hypothetical protein